MRLMCSATDNQVVKQPRKCLEIVHKCSLCLWRKKGLCVTCQNKMSGTSYQTILFNTSKAAIQVSVGVKFIISSQNLDVVDVSIMAFYIPATNSWGAFQVESSSFTNTAVLKEYLYATAEALDSDEIYRYNPENGCCNDLKKPATNLCYICFVTDEKYIYLIGGKSHYLRGTALSTTYRCDPSADDHGWEEVAPINQARYNAFGAAMNDKVYIAGGCQGQEALKTCEVYNPLTDEWQLMPSLKVPRMSASMVCHKGRLYALGGVIPSSGRLSRVLSVETFDSEQNEWRKKSVIPVDCFETSEEKKQMNKFKACLAKLSKVMIVKLEPLKK